VALQRDIKVFSLMPRITCCTEHHSRTGSIRTAYWRAFGMKSQPACKSLRQNAMKMPQNYASFHIISDLHYPYDLTRYLVTSVETYCDVFRVLLERQLAACPGIRDK
jgi:hypothetical protein